MENQEQFILRKQGVPAKLQRGKIIGSIFLAVGIFVAVAAMLAASGISDLERMLSNSAEIQVFIGCIAGVLIAVYGVLLILNPVMLKNNCVTVYEKRVDLNYRESVFSKEVLLHGLKNIKTIKLALNIDKIDAVSASRSGMNEFLEITASGVTRKIIIADPDQLADAINQLIG